MSNLKRPILLVGAKGMLARKIAALAPQGRLVSVARPEFDLTDREQVLKAVDAISPELIINCGAYTNVDGCETEEALASRVNGSAVGYLAEAACRVDATLVHISTDYVFSGEKGSPYVEGDETHPHSAYGRSKLLGEEAVRASGLKKYFIVRTSWLYGPGGKNFVETILRLALEREELGIVADQVGTPTYTGDLAEAVFALAALDEKGSEAPPYGIYHFSNEGQCSWYDFAVEIVRIAAERGGAVKVRNIKPIRTEDYPLPAQRPRFSVFSKEKYRRVTGRKVPGWKESLCRYFDERQDGLS